MSKYVVVTSDTGYFKHLTHRVFLYTLCGAKVSKDRGMPEAYTCTKCFGWSGRFSEYRRLGLDVRMPKATRERITAMVKRFNE